MPPAAFLHPQNASKSLAAGALPQTQLWKLTALPTDPLARSRGLLLRGREKKGGGKETDGRGEEEIKRRGKERL